MAEEVGYFQEDNGSKSAMRLMSITALFAAIGFGLLTILLDDTKVNVSGLYITFGFMLAAFAPKALQKFAEEKINQG